DDEVEVGAVIARVGDESAKSSSTASAPEPETAGEPEPEPEAESKPESAPEPAPEPTKDPERATEPEAKQEAPRAPAPPKTPASSTTRVYVTPIVRKLAAEKGVDLEGLQGTGVGGRIRKEDVLQAASSTPASKDVGATERKASSGSARITEASPLRGSTEKMSRLRKIVATRAVESMTTMAQLTTVVEVDVTRVAKLRDAVKAEFLEKTGTKLSFLPFFSLAAVEALKAHPKINSTDDGESITYPDTENLAMAVDTERGLLTPVIKNAGELNLREYAEQIADLASRTRDNKLSPDELAGGTFTLTNTGSRGALFDTPVVFQPQRAILGVGTVVKRPVVVSGPEGDSIAIRSTVYLALSYDHRTIDGADAARYLTAVKARLEEGDFEQDLGI
ncbi:MAG TPA: 2-oxoglutarate dehydrogenase, E2 component, dihydrolipoamide succinyltransferase, partial [Candidatus Agrococcus pullicola]|nr:2-oxoglutarate dehydrogenase, E2 component, dihydrolipoamide succinyltransferase [Candidatus Agrococcus pullicola]